MPAHHKDSCIAIFLASDSVLTLSSVQPLNKRLLISFLIQHFLLYWTTKSFSVLLAHHIAKNRSPYGLLNNGRKTYFMVEWRRQEFLAMIFKKRPGLNFGFLNYKICLIITESTPMSSEQRGSYQFTLALFSVPWCPDLLLFLQTTHSGPALRILCQKQLDAFFSIHTTTSVRLKKINPLKSVWFISLWWLFSNLKLFRLVSTAQHYSDKTLTLDVRCIYISSPSAFWKRFLRHTYIQQTCVLHNFSLGPTPIRHKSSILHWTSETTLTILLW